MLSAITFLSCSKDEDDSNVLEGRWYLFSTETIRREAGSTRIDIDTLDDREYYFDFQPNGVFQMSSTTGRYTLVGDSLHISAGEGDEEERLSFKYSVDRENLTLSITEPWRETVYEDIHRFKRL